MLEKENSQRWGRVLVGGFQKMVCSVVVYRFNFDYVGRVWSLLKQIYYEEGE